MSSRYGLRGIRVGEASNPGPLHSSQAKSRPDAGHQRDSSPDSPQSRHLETERDVMRHVAQFDLARFDSSCDENTRGHVETSDAPRRRLVLVSQGVPLETNVASAARDLSDSETESVVSRANLDDSHDQRLRRVRPREEE